MTGKASKRVEAIALLRQWAREQIAKGKPVNSVYFDLVSATNTIEQELLTEHEMPGCRYWHHPESDSYFITPPGETLKESDPESDLCVELTRYEYLSRQDLHFGYHDSGL